MNILSVLDRCSKCYSTNSCAHTRIVLCIPICGQQGHMTVNAPCAPKQRKHSPHIGFKKMNLKTSAKNS